MKTIIVNKKDREIYIDGKRAGVGWTEKMDNDIAKFGRKIGLAVTKCIFIKINEKHDLNPWETFRLQENLRSLFNV